MSSPQLDAAKLGKYLLIVMGDAVELEISCVVCSGPEAIFYQGYQSRMDSEPWLAVAAQHVLDFHPE